MQKLNFAAKNYDRILFCSDTHIDHKRDFVFQPRGFKTPEEHSSFVIDSLVSLTNKDLLIFLGDFALNTTDERVQNILESLQCESYFLWGNHNSGLKHSYKTAVTNFCGENNVDVYPVKVASNISMVGDSALISIDGKKVFCCHFPWKVWDGQQHGWMHCHGHNHSNLAGSQPNDLDNGKILDCGIDNALKYNGTIFFSFQEIVEIMNKKPLKTFDHH